MDTAPGTLTAREERTLRFELALIALGTVGAVTVLSLQARKQYTAAFVMTVLGVIGGGILGGARTVVRLGA